MAVQTRPEMINYLCYLDFFNSGRSKKWKYIDLPVLSFQFKVRDVQDNLWTPGMITSQADPLSYWIEMASNMSWRRHISQHLSASSTCADPFLRRCFQLTINSMHFINPYALGQIVEELGQQKACKSKFLLLLICILLISLRSVCVQHKVCIWWQEAIRKLSKIYNKQTNVDNSIGEKQEQVEEG